MYDRFFSHIEVDESWSAAVRDAAARGTVVYVMRSISFLDFLCLDYLVKQLNLPLVRFANDLGLWLLEPFGKGRRAGCAAVRSPRIAHSELRCWMSTAP